MTWDIWWALTFMLIGATITHVSWLHAWKMYRNGKSEGQGFTGTRPNGSRVVR